MKIQSTNFSCGPIALIYALRCFGKRYSEERMIRLCRTTRRDGTSSRKLIKAIKKVHFESQTWHTSNKKLAIEKLFKAFCFGPVLLCVDQDKHWIAALAPQCDRIIILDPQGGYYNRRNDNGCYILKKSQLLRRWISKKGRYYGIAVFPR